MTKKKIAYFGSISSHGQNRQFWQHGNHPFDLYSNAIIGQKINFYHNNPVETGSTDSPEKWRLRSANLDSPIAVIDL